MQQRALLVTGLLSMFTGAATAHAETLNVGPTRTYKQLDELPRLSPGDVVELDGDATYTGGVALYDHGTASQPIIVRGVRVNGARPIIAGGTNTLLLGGNHYRIENVEITGGSFRCVFHVADDITLERVLIRDCPRHGLLGADAGSGSLTLRFSEVRNCGSGLYDHQIYMATDESAYPGSVFRMEHTYVHDANGGASVKSRAERNEIYYNWIEGGIYHELELIGPDGQHENLAREDSDVVGNVLRKTGPNQDFYVIRTGGDGTGQTWGRYRFAYNTILLAPGATQEVFRIFDGNESVEMHANVLVRQGGDTTPIQVYRTVEASWSTGNEVVTGAGNWIPTNAQNIPAGWSNTITGASPGFVDLDRLNLHPNVGSALLGAVTPATSPVGYSVPTPLLVPAYQPVAQPLVSGDEPLRHTGEDIGALEPADTTPHEPPDAGSGSLGPDAGSIGGDSDAGTGGSTTGDSDAGTGGSTTGESDAGMGGSTTGESDAGTGGSTTGESDAGMGGGVSDSTGTSDHAATTLSGGCQGVPSSNGVILVLLSLGALAITRRRPAVRDSDRAH